MTSVSAVTLAWSRGSSAAACLAAASLARTLPDRYSRGEHDIAGSRVVEHQRAQRVAGGGRVGAEQVGDASRRSSPWRSRHSAIASAGFCADGRGAGASR